MKMTKTICCMVMIASLTCLAFAQEAKQDARIADLDGDVKVKRHAQKEWLAAEKGMALNEGDIIKTGAGAGAVVELEKGEAASIEVAEKSELLLTELARGKEGKTRKTLVDLAMGSVLVKAGKLLTSESNFHVKTPTSVVGVRGTKFSVKVEALGD